jgi:hypothetical protein
MFVWPHFGLIDAGLYYASACIQDNPFWNNLSFNLQELMVNLFNIKYMCNQPNKIFLDHLVSGIGIYRG